MSVEPFTIPVFGMIPVAKLPIGTSTVPAACALVKQAVIVGGEAAAFFAATTNDSCWSPSSVVSSM